MRSFTLAKALTGANSQKDYADMAEGRNNTISYSYAHAPYQIGDRNLINEYTTLLKQKGVRV